MSVWHEFLPRDAMHKRGLCRHADAVSVCVSVTFVDHVKTNKDIFEIFHHRVATPFEFFRTKRRGNILTGNTLTRASNVEIAILSQYLASLHAVYAATGQVLSVRRHRTTVML